jgi:hypothetical protein
MQWGWNYFPYRSKRLHYQDSAIGNETVSDHFDLLRQLVERPTSRLRRLDSFHRADVAG